MSDANEMVVVETDNKARWLLYGNVINQVRAIECASGESLDLGFTLPAGWPTDQGVEVTFSQLVVLARKLKMKITIRELRMDPI